MPRPPVGIKWPVSSHVRLTQVPFFFLPPHQIISTRGDGRRQIRMKRQTGQREIKWATRNERKRSRWEDKNKKGKLSSVHSGLAAVQKRSDLVTSTKFGQRNKPPFRPPPPKKTAFHLSMSDIHDHKRLNVLGTTA